MEFSVAKGSLVAVVITLAFEFLVWKRPLSQDTAARIVEHVILVLILKPVMLRYLRQASLPVCRLVLLFMCIVCVRVANKKIRI